MKRTLKLLAVAAIIAVATTGCATIMHGEKQSVSVVSGKENTKIVITDEAGNTVAEGQNQVAVSLKRGKEFFKGANYKIVAQSGEDKQEMMLSPSVNGAYIAGNLFFGGLIGWVVIDPVTGGMWTLKTPDGQEAKEVKVLLKENVPVETMEKAKKVEEK